MRAEVFSLDRLLSLNMPLWTLGQCLQIAWKKVGVHIIIELHRPSDDNRPPIQSGGALVAGAGAVMDRQDSI
jgi:hypothetical protein